MKNIILTVLPWLIFGLFGFYLISNNFTAKLGIIDDHEIAMFLGNDGKINITEIPKAIMSTEVGQWGTNLRYRPSYHALRVIESSLWRDNAKLWYISHYLILVVSMWLGWTILTIYYPQIISYLFVFYIMALPFWPDVFTRLGPSETYATLTVLIFIYGLIKNNLWLITVGYLISVGSKENLIVLLPVLLCWTTYRYLTTKITKSDFAVTFILTIYTIFIAASIFIATAKTGTDFYGSRISYRYIFTRFFWDLPKIVITQHMIPSLVAICIGIYTTTRLWTRIGWKKVLENSVAKQLFAMLVVLAVAGSQYIFYTNKLPSNMRYDFPALLLFPVLDLMAFSLLMDIFKKRKYIRILTVAGYTAIALICGLYIFNHGYSAIQLQAKKNAVLSQNFDTQLNLATEKLKDNPDVLVMFVTNRYLSFELVISASRYLNSRSINNKYVLYYTPEENVTNPLGLELQDRLINVMDIGGDSEEIFKRFSKFKGFNEPCLSLIFGDADPLPQCPAIAKF